MAAKGYKTYSLAVLEQYAIERFEEGRAPNTLKVSAQRVVDTGVKKKEIGCFILTSSFPVGDILDEKVHEARQEGGCRKSSRSVQGNR